MFTILFDNDSKEPMYLQLYKFIRKEVETGQLKSGEKLPSKRHLALHLKVSTNTVETAYAQLTAEGYIRSEPKKGYFVEPIINMPANKYKDISATRNKNNENNKSNKDIIIKNSKPLYDFKTNAVDIEDFPFATWAKISRNILSEKRSKILTSVEPQGLYELRAEITKYLYDFRGIKSKPEQIVIGAGSEYLISMLVKLLGNNRIYGVENPGYHKIFKIFKSSSVNVVMIPLDKSGLSVRKLEESEADAVHVTPSHHFPLGTVMPVKRRMELIEWAENDPKRYIIEDDYDSEFRFSGRPIQALRGLSGTEKVIYINTFAKSLAPSFRISYMVLPENLMKEYNEKLYFYSSTVPGFEQYILTDFMKNGYFERHISRMKNTYKKRQEIMINAIKSGKLNDITDINGQDAGLHLLLNLKNGMSEKELTNKALEYGVKVYGLSGYYEDNDGNRNENIPQSTVVAGFSGLKDNEIEEGIRLLEKAWCI